MVSAIGFIFFDKSPRYIHPINAVKLAKLIPIPIKKVGVFVNEPLDKIKYIINNSHTKAVFVEDELQLEKINNQPNYQVTKNTTN